MGSSRSLSLKTHCLEGFLSVFPPIKLFQGHRKFTSISGDEDKVVGETILKLLS